MASKIKFEDKEKDFDMESGSETDDSDESTVAEELEEKNLDDEIDDEVFDKDKDEDDDGLMEDKLVVEDLNSHLKILDDNIPTFREKVVDFDDTEEDDDATYQKVEDYLVQSDLEKHHPEIRSSNFEEIMALTRIVRDNTGKIIDPLHKTIPLVTKYEKARIIGTRAEQLDNGAAALIPLDSSIICGRTIALMEYEQKKIPFIIARPLPNRSIEYWRLQDLEYV